ncbi:Pr6Pr family membrane protein [Microbacterium sp. NPDC089695]|uniref:Pr6Pr family membrane protein n=1 Tax=Microbacterium sp. NPDC089695 TaxID=3364198 RepID=UPI00380C5707
MENRVSVWGRAWFAGVAVVVFVGFVLQFYLLFTGGADANSGDAGNTIPLGVRFVRLFSFFTVQSNLFVLIAALLLAIRGTLGRVGRVVYLDALLGIIVTGAAFSFILDPDLQLRGVAAVVTALFHNVSPIAMALGWLLWGPRRQWTWKIIPLAFIWPVAWLVGTFVRGAITGWYPYLFLDVPKVGLGAALAGAGMIVVFTIILTAILLAVDRRLPRVPFGLRSRP